MQTRTSALFGLDTNMKQVALLVNPIEKSIASSRAELREILMSATKIEGDLKQRPTKTFISTMALVLLLSITVVIAIIVRFLPLAY